MPTRTATRSPGSADAERVTRETITALKKLASTKLRDEMKPRYGIETANAFGVPMLEMKRVAKSLGKSHALAEALWASGSYEARTVAAFVDEPDRVTVAQMNRWCGDFDNWAICDTVCFHLFDRTPHAFGRVEAWAAGRREFEVRAAFALLASLALHRKDLDDAAFREGLVFAERCATDERNFVKKAVSWSLRAIATRSPALRSEVAVLSTRLAQSTDATARWIGRDAKITREPVNGKPAKKGPVAKKPATKKAATKKPATKGPVAKKPATKKPARDESE